MSSRTSEDTTISAIIRLFGKHLNLEEYRLSPAEIDPDLANQLIDQGFVIYDTETGIALQQPKDWDIILSEKGKLALLEDPE